MGGTGLRCWAWDVGLKARRRRVKDFGIWELGACRFVGLYRRGQAQTWSHGDDDDHDHDHDHDHHHYPRHAEGKTLLIQGSLLRLFYTHARASNDLRAQAFRS